MKLNESIEHLDFPKLDYSWRKLRDAHKILLTRNYPWETKTNLCLKTTVNTYLEINFPTHKRFGLLYKVTNIATSNVFQMYAEGIAIKIHDLVYNFDT